MRLYLHPRGPLCLLPLPALSVSLATLWKNAVLDPINQALARSRASHDPKRRGPLNRQGLLNFFIAECIDQLQHHQKHRISPNVLAQARTGLMGQERFKVVRSCFAVGKHHVAYE